MGFNVYIGNISLNYVAAGGHRAGKYGKDYRKINCGHDSTDHQQNDMRLEDWKG